MPDLEKVKKGLECIAQKCEPTENPCKDCGYSDRPNYAICVKDIASDALELLKEQEKPKTGHWIPIKSPTGVEAFGIKEMTVFDVRCSVCGAEEDVSFTGYKYCPRCGAKMEGR